MQLRENLRVQWNFPYSITEERCFEAAALALQADFGDHRPKTHQTGYFRPESYFPIWVINAHGLSYITQHMPRLHLDLSGVTREEAMRKFCRLVSLPPLPLNAHAYSLRKTKLDLCDQALLSISAHGLSISEINTEGERQNVTNMAWSQIGKLTFEVSNLLLRLLIFF